MRVSNAMYTNSAIKKTRSINEKDLISMEITSYEIANVGNKYLTVLDLHGENIMQL